MEDINNEERKCESCVHWSENSSVCYFSLMKSLDLIKETIEEKPCKLYEKKYEIYSYWVEKVYTTPENIYPQKTYYKYVCHICNNENMVLPTNMCYKCLLKMTHIQFLDGSIGEVKDCSKCKYNTDDENIGCNRECCDPYTGRFYPDWKLIMNDPIVKKEEPKKEPVVEEDKPSDTNSIEDYMTDLFTSTINI